MATIKGHGPTRKALRGAIDGATIWWVAPTFTIASIIWRQLKKSCHYGWTDKSEVEHRIDLPGGGSVAVRSADNPDSLVGEGLDGLVMDEAAYIREDVWNLKLRPALTDKQGWSIFFSTPNGPNWFQKLFESAGHEEDAARWQRPSSDNPLMTAKEMEKARIDMGLRGFAQEHLAQFVDTAGSEFSGAYFGESIWFDDWPPDDQIRFRVITLDPSLGRTDKSDYSAFVMSCLTWDGTMYVDADISRRDPRQIVDDGLALAKWFKPDAFGVEAVGFQSILADIFAERSKLAGMMLPLHAVYNNEDKRTRIRARLTPYLARGEFRFRRNSPGCKLLVDQTRAFPIDKHDDGPDALEMAVRLTQHVFEHGLEQEQAA